MRTSVKPIKATRFFAFLRATLGVYVKKSMRINITVPIKTEPPFILLGSHVNSYDPFIMAYGLKHPVNYVTSDSYFRTPILRFLLKRLGCIPKTKSMADMASARTMINALRGGAIIGVYPEGARSWDGHVLPLIYSTAKLIRLLKADVVAARLDGGMFALPRWSKRRRKGPVFLSYRKVLDAEESGKLSTDEIYSRISEALYYDEYEFQRAHMNKYTGKNLAKGLERFLYVCPKCGSFHSLKSKGDSFTCASCGYSVTYNEYGFFEGKDVIYEDTRSWNLYQESITAKQISEGISAEAHNVLLYTGGRNLRSLQKLKFGRFIISEGRIFFINIRKQTTEFQAGSITGVNIQSNYKLEFYMGETLYRFNFAKSNISAYAIKKILAGLCAHGGVENG